MRLLALDTSTDACSVALLDGERLSERYELAPRVHAERVLPMLEALLAEAGLGLRDLDALAFGRGPGSFTGVRIATGLAQGLALGAGLPVVPVSSLAALAHGLGRRHGPGRVLAALDARMDEVYWGLYDCPRPGEARGLLEEQVCAPERVHLPTALSAEALASGQSWRGAGSGWARYEHALRAALPEVALIEPALAPRAADIALLAAEALARGEALDCAAALPVYLRDRVVQTVPGQGPET